MTPRRLNDCYRPAPTGNATLPPPPTGGSGVATAPITRLWHDNRALRAALHRAIDAMSRPPENAITDPEWDQIIAEGRNVLGDENG